jgi:flavin reductase (DIM6/NTAB) family NADH-FMN oxidoreductase RutF
LDEIISQLSEGGVFLNSSHNGNINTMTIGWACFGFIWNKPVVTVAVRYSRHTYELINESGVFTISVPAYNVLKKELTFCGSRSGRDYDKFKETGLTLVSGRKVDVPVIGECGMHFECKVIYKQAMEPALIDAKIDEKFYKGNDFHVLFYGEILDFYSL